MEKMQTLPQLREALMGIEKQIVNIAGHLHVIEDSLNGNPRQEADSAKKSNIIAFPGLRSGGENSSRRFPLEFDFLVPILARPGEALPRCIPDFRAALQRDGLILLSWAKKHTEMGERFTAYWVTSQGINRYYASGDMELGRFASAMPVHKSYAAEDGIEFYGQDQPAYIVHVAPDLMMGRRQAGDRRPEHINTLKSLGMKADYGYRFLLTKEKKKRTAPIEGVQAARVLYG
jgi:hypothetical protein